jgi:hypothetical protein
MRRLRGWAGVVLFVLAGSALEACVVVGDVLHGTRDRIVFSHKQHLDMKGGSGHAAEVKMCSACHFPTPNDPRGEEPGEPLEASCLVCHGEWKTKNDCWKCHSDAQTPLTYSEITDRPKIFFSHARHQERVDRLEEKGCAYCHPSAWTEQDDSGGVRLSQDPESEWHEICFKCHIMRTEWDRMNCAKCHARLSDREGLRPLSRFHHEGNWIAQHGDQLVGRPDGLGLCARCHDRGYCVDCHDARDSRRVRPELKFPDRPDRAFIHRGDYLNRHVFEARANPADCMRCHATQGFCKNCHQARGVTNTQVNVGNLLGYHNGSYAEFMSPTSPLFHGRTARRDAPLCATCHDYGKDTVCVQCHADPNVRTPILNGGNPHPPGFKSAIPKTSPPCSYCHVVGGGH